jgi:hypothetical protein
MARLQSDHALLLFADSGTLVKDLLVPFLLGSARARRVGSFS